MIVSRIDPEARSTHAAAKGFRALCEGDTVLAREKYAEAGEILERGSKRDVPAADKHLLRFLAASQYYHAGEYQRAAKLVAKINRGHLRPGDRPTLDQFRKDVEERADPGYAARILHAVSRSRKEGNIEVAIRLLQDHPFVMGRWALAWTRADLCLRSGRIKAAILFSADAIRFSDQHPAPIFLRAGAATFLKASGKPAEAAEFLRLVQEKEPTPLDLSSVVSELFERIRRGQSDAGEEVLRLMDRAQREFAELPPPTTADTDVRLCMAHGFLLAAIVADLLHGRQAALRYVEAGEALAPPGIVTGIFRIMRASADGHWIHDAQIAEQLDATTSQIGTRQRFVEETTLTKDSVAA